MASLSYPSIHKPNNSLLSSTRRTNSGIPGSVVMLQMCHSFQEVSQLHAQLVVSGLLDHSPNAGRLVQSYVSVSQICYASSVFDTLFCADVFAYNTMIRGLMLGNRPYDSLLLYNKLLLVGSVPDSYTYTFVLKACSYLRALFEGKQIHGQIIRAGIEPETHILSSLIYMYANSGSMASAERALAEFPKENVLAKNSLISGYFNHGCADIAGPLFNEMTERNIASWSAMITGYTKNGMYLKALNVFRDILLSEVLPNESTLVSALSACAHLGALDQGRSVHAYIQNIWGLEISVRLGTALVNMYAKCGSIICGYEVFKKMSQKDVIAWGAVISGFAVHGQAKKCFELFDEMLDIGIQPNSVIFVGILSACRHVGDVELGKSYFHRMLYEFGVKPSIEHYGCIVDLLGRSGRLEEAEEVILSMPNEANLIIWGAFLSACRTHKDLVRGRRAFRHLTELEPMCGDRYKLAGHMFASVGKKREAAKLRKFIKEKELHTTCGSSFIELDGTIHEFSTGNIHSGEIES